jgi:L-ribulose-5-phosphate 3-epimerase
MIKLGCNAMVKTARQLPHPGKDDARNWVDIEQLIRMIYDLRLDIIDFQLYRGFRSSEPIYLSHIKKLCQQYGLPIGFLGVGSGFVKTEKGADGKTVGAPLAKQELRQCIDEVKKGIDLAAFMSAPMVRLFGGGIPKDSPDRDALWTTVVHSFQEVSDYAADKGIFTGLHNHAPASAPTGDDILRLLRDVNRDNFTYILDTGQWYGSPGSSGDWDDNDNIDFYQFMEQTAPHATYVRAKIYKIDSGREELIDYERVMDILRKVNFNGNMSIVFEDQGNMCNAAEAIALAVKFLRGLLR